MPPPTHSSLTTPSATLPRSPADRQLFLRQPQQGGGNPISPPHPTPRNTPYSTTLGRSASASTAPAPPTRGGGVTGAQTLPRARTSAPHGSSLSAVEQLGAKSPPPSAGFGSAASAGFGGSNPVPSARGTVAWLLLPPPPGLLVSCRALAVPCASLCTASFHFSPCF